MSTQQEIIKEIIQRSLMIKVGERAIYIIKKRVAEGKFLEGSSDGASQYSTKPFAMPVGGVRPKSVMMKMLKGKYDDDTQLFQTKAGKMWVSITKGYKWLREQAGKNTSKVDLTWTRELMRSMTVLSTDIKSGEIEIGHKGDRNDKLAEYHNVSGAGKGKKKRVYLSMTDAELQKLADRL